MNEENTPVNNNEKKLIRNPDGNRELVPCVNAIYTYSKDQQKFSVQCNIGEFDGNPKVRDCFACGKYQPKFQIDRFGEPVGDVPPDNFVDSVDQNELDVPRKSRGLGDTIAKTTKRFGIKPCGACKKRQEKLNKMFAYKANKASGDCKDCKKGKERS